MLNLREVNRLKITPVKIRLWDNTKCYLKFWLSGSSIKTMQAWQCLLIEVIFPKTFI